MNLELTYQKRTNLAAYTMDRLNAIAEYKIAYITSYLPVACALYMVCTDVSNFCHYFSVLSFCLSSISQPSALSNTVGLPIVIDSLPMGHGVVAAHGHITVANDQTFAYPRTHRKIRNVLRINIISLFCIGASLYYSIITYRPTQLKGKGTV